MTQTRTLNRRIKFVEGQGKYHYKESGLDNVYLRGGFSWVETPRGKTVHIKDVEGLHRAIGRVLITEKKNLSGKEFRFLRHELSLTQNSLGLILSVDAQSIARWEKGKSEIPGPAQGLLRVLYNAHIDGHAKVTELLKSIADLDESIDEESCPDFNFVERKGWRAAA